MVMQNCQVRISIGQMYNNLASLIFMHPSLYMVNRHTTIERRISVS